MNIVFIIFFNIHGQILKSDNWLSIVLSVRLIDFKPHDRAAPCPRTVAL